MIALNLTAKGAEQEIVKKHLEENASEVLADKINNGVRIEKDGKTLISRKTLDGFMKYANEEARKQAEKGATSACIIGDVVFGWAIHYFEEDSIEGTLYNEDGSDYKAPRPTKTATKTTVKTTPPIKKEEPKLGQLYLFDVAEEEPTEEVVETEEPIYTVDTQTGELLEELSVNGDDLLQTIMKLFDGDLEVHTK